MALGTICALAALLLVFAPSAFAVTFTVNSNGDQADADVGMFGCDVGSATGVCTLRAAIEESNQSIGETDVINFSGVSGDIVLTSTLPSITDAVTINGPGADQLAIDGSGHRVLEVPLGPTNISGLTIKNGSASGGANVAGGGISSTASLTLDRVVVTQNNATGTDTTLGGGIYAGAGTLTLRRSTVSANNSAVSDTGTGSPHAYGGGIYAYNGTTLVLDHSTVSGNHASVTVSSPTSPSSASSYGGGVYADGPIQVYQSTISGNTASATGAPDGNTANGGGLVQGNNSGMLSVTGSTFSDNALAATAPISVFTNGANVSAGLNGGTFGSSIVANPVGASGDSCTTNGSPLSSNGFNLDEDDSCGFTQATDLTGDPMLAPLANNGGPTQTQALPANSPAIDQGKSFDATTDQRGAGFRRVSNSPIADADGGDGADIGAYELDFTPPNKPAITASVPKSPANNNDPKLRGVAEAGSTVRIYKTADCSGIAVKAGLASAFASPGLSVHVANNSTTTFHATATDAAHNKSACSNGFTYREDSTAPITTIDSVTVSHSLHRARVAFSSNEPGSTFQCSIDGAPFAACASPKTYNGLASGSHAVRVVARDKAHNADQTPAKRTFTV